MWDPTLFFLASLQGANKKKTSIYTTAFFSVFLRYKHTYELTGLFSSLETLYPRGAARKVVALRNASVSVPKLILQCIFSNGILTTHNVFLLLIPTDVFAVLCYMKVAHHDHSQKNTKHDRGHQVQQLRSLLQAVFFFWRNLSISLIFCNNSCLGFSLPITPPIHGPVWSPIRISKLRSSCVFILSSSNNMRNAYLTIAIAWSCVFNSEWFIPNTQVRLPGRLGMFGFSLFLGRHLLSSGWPCYLHTSCEGVMVGGRRVSEIFWSDPIDRCAYRKATRVAFLFTVYFAPFAGFGNISVSVYYRQISGRAQ